LAEKHDDRHIRNKIEGVNRSRGEAGVAIHHLFMAKLKGYEDWGQTLRFDPALPQETQPAPDNGTGRGSIRFID
jgi:hypothetical protein